MKPPKVGGGGGPHSYQAYLRWGLIETGGLFERMAYLI